MVKLKGFVFTIDAVFALIVASAAVGILVYSHFSEPSTFQITSALASSTAQAMLQTPLAASSAAIAKIAANAGSAYNIWPYYSNGYGLVSSSGYGPLLPDLLFQHVANAQITSPPAAALGYVAFATGNEIYLLNATSGNLISGYPISISGNVLYPLFYGSSIIYGNSTGYLAARNLKGNAIWSKSLGVVPTTPISIEDNYVVFGSGDEVMLVNPLNGTLIASSVLTANVALPSYNSGEFVVATSQIGSPNELYGFALVGGSLRQVWSSNALTKAHTTSPVTFGNVISVGSGGNIYGFGLGGNQLWSISVNSNVTGGAAALDGNLYYSTQKNLYIINVSCNCISSVSSIPYTGYNATPSVTPYGVYTLANGTRFISSQVPGGGSQMPSFNVQLPITATLPYQDVALAYGNAYLVAGNTIYAFGTCRASPQENILQSAASMYISGQGGCADLLVNSSSNSGNDAVLINGTYAPSLATGLFNGKNSYVAVPNTGDLTFSSTVTVAAWVNANPEYPTNPSGTTDHVILSGGPDACSGSGGSYTLYGGSGSNALFQFCVYTGSSYNTVQYSPVNLSQWYFVAGTYNGSYICLYVNGVLAAHCTAASGIMPAPSYIGMGSDISSSGLPNGYYNGSIADAQIYNLPLSSKAIMTLYQEGFGGVPPNTTALAGWWPLDGNSNDYGSAGNVGYPTNVLYTATNFTPASLLNAYEIGAATFPLPLGAGAGVYNVSLAVWR